MKRLLKLFRVKVHESFMFVEDAHSWLQLNDENVLDHCNSYKLSVVSCEDITNSKLYDKLPV